VTETFKVGQKVRHTHYGDGIVTYGPYKSTFGEDAYLVRREDGIEKTWFGRFISALPEPSKFAVGDKVAVHGRPEGTLVAGPFTGHFDDVTFWVVEHNDGGHTTPTEHVLSKVADPKPEPIKIGDRVRVVYAKYAKYAEEAHGKLATVQSVTDGWTPSTGEHHPYTLRVDGLSGTYWARDVERVTDEDVYEYDGVIYDLSAKYQDRDGDVWHFARFGDKVVGLIGSKPQNEDDGDPFTFAANYGPLTRI